MVVRVAICAVLTASILSGRASAAIPMDGQYCKLGQGKDYSMLLVRQELSPVLEFAFSMWTSGHNFSVAGSALGGGDQWVFESGMNSRDPAERCKITITRSDDGSYRVATTEGARCEANGGNRAVPLEPESLPADTRIASPPKTFGMGTLSRLGCEKPRPGTRSAPLTPSGLIFPMKAQTGTQTQRAQVFAKCNPGATPLAIEISVDDKNPRYDVAPFDGPSPDAGTKLLTHLAVTKGGATTAVKLPAAGVFTSSTSFLLVPYIPPKQAAMTKGIKDVVRAMTDGPSTFLWEQGAATTGSAALKATMEFTATDAEQLKAVLAPCLTK